MSRWIEITGTSQTNLKNRAKAVSDKIHEFLNDHYKASQYAKLGSSIRVHKTELKVIIKIPKVGRKRWDLIKNKLGQIPNWVTPKQISNDDPNYFDNDII